MKARMCLLVLATSAWVGSSALRAEFGPSGMLCEDPIAASPYDVLAGDQYLGRQQPNLIVTGTYQTHMRTGQLSLVQSQSPSSDPKMLTTNLIVDARHGNGGCQAFRGAFVAGPGQYDQVYVTDGKGHEKTADVELHR